MRAIEATHRVKRIYLAGPYTHKDPVVMQDRFEFLTKVAVNLVSLGYFVFSPITHSHPLNLKLNIYEFAHWRSYDLIMIAEWADEVWVVPIDGWQESTGVIDEIRFTKEIGKLAIVLPQLLKEEYGSELPDSIVTLPKEKPKYYEYL